MNTNASPAAAVISLPHFHHPVLGAVVRELAATPGISPDLAASVLTAVQRGLGISDLDLEMSQPGSSVRVPFVANERPRDGDTEYQDMVRSHLLKLEARR